MEIKKDCSFSELQEMCWSGAVDTLNTISKHDKEDEFMQYLEEVFYDDIPTKTEVNDFIWFEDDAIFEALDINLEDKEEPEEEE